MVQANGGIGGGGTEARVGGGSEKEVGGGKNGMGRGSENGIGIKSEGGIGIGSEKEGPGDSKASGEVFSTSEVSTRDSGVRTVG